MAIDPSIEAEKSLSQLEIAAELVAFDNRRRIAVALPCAIGAIFLFQGLYRDAGKASGIVTAFIGGGLLWSSAYVILTKTPKALVVCSFSYLAMAAASLVSAYDQRVSGYALTWNVVVILGLTLVARSHFRMARAQKALLDASDGKTNQDVEHLLRVMRNKSQQHNDIVEWKVTRGTLMDEQGIWRLAPYGEMFLLACFGEGVFGFGGHATQAMALGQNDVLLTVEGGRWRDKKVRARLRIQGEVTSIAITQEMLDRLQSLLGVADLSVPIEP